MFSFRPWKHIREICTVGSCTNSIKLDTQFFIKHPGGIGNDSKYPYASSQSIGLCKDAICHSGEIISTGSSEITHRYNKSFTIFLQSNQLTVNIFCTKYTATGTIDAEHYCFYIILPADIL